MHQSTAEAYLLLQGLADTYQEEGQTPQASAARSRLPEALANLDLKPGGYQEG